MNTRYTALSLAVVLLVAAVAPAAAATAPVDGDAVGDLSVTVAPASTAPAAAAEATTQSATTDSIIAVSDVAVLRLNASGIPAEADDDGTLLGDEVEVTLRQTEGSVGTNATAKTLDATADSEAVGVNVTSDAVYVAVDLASATFQQGNGTATAAVGDSFDATATVTDAVTDGENYSRTVTFSAVEPSVNFLSDVDEAPAGETVNYDAATTLAPGTSLTFTLTAEGTTDTTTQVTIGDQGRATGQFSFFTLDANESYTITVDAEGVDLNTTWTGTTYATGTETPAPANATDGATDDGTSTSGPGFGVVAALIALLGTAAVAGRRE